jgi:hypothetical protein
LKLRLKSVGAGWNATRPAEVASSGLEISISRRSGCSSAEVADLQSGKRKFGRMHHDPANTPHFQLPSRISGALRQTSGEVAQLRPNRGHSRRSSSPSAGFAMFRFSSAQADCFPAFSAGAIPLQPARRISSRTRGFTALLAHLQPNSDFSAGIGFSAPILIPLRLLSSISSGTY